MVKRKFRGNITYVMVLPHFLGDGLEKLGRIDGIAAARRKMRGIISKMVLEECHEEHIDRQIVDRVTEQICQSIEDMVNAYIVCRLYAANGTYKKYTCNISIDINKISTTLLSDSKGMEPPAIPYLIFSIPIQSFNSPVITYLAFFSSDIFLEPVKNITAFNSYISCSSLFLTAKSDSIAGLNIGNARAVIDAPIINAFATSRPVRMPPPHPHPPSDFCSS